MIATAVLEFLAAAAGTLHIRFRFTARMYELPDEGGLARSNVRIERLILLPLRIVDNVLNDRWAVRSGHDEDGH